MEDSQPNLQTPNLLVYTSSWTGAGNGGALSLCRFENGVCLIDPPDIRARTTHRLWFRLQTEHSERRLMVYSCLGRLLDQRGRPVGTQFWPIGLKAGASISGALELNLRELCLFQSRGLQLRFSDVTQIPEKDDLPNPDPATQYYVSWTNGHPGFLGASGPVRLGSQPETLRLENLLHPSRPIELVADGVSGRKLRQRRIDLNSWELRFDDQATSDKLELYAIDSNARYAESIPVAGQENRKDD